MTKSKSGGLAKLPQGQRCKFFIGPVGSWFMPNTTDLWTQEDRSVHPHQSAVEIEPKDDSETDGVKPAPKTTYFAYGSIGCFCYGQVHLKMATTNNEPASSNTISATTDHLVDIKDDNSRVSCVRFARDSTYPFLMVLTENGSLLIHDCLTDETIYRFKKNEILTKFAGIINNDLAKQDNQYAKRAKSITQQVNCITWPCHKEAFVAISLLSEKSCQLLWLRLQDIMLDRYDKLSVGDNCINKNNVVKECIKIDLNLGQYSSPICLIDSMCFQQSKKQLCLVAVAMDDGLITVVSVDLSKDQSSRVIKLARHNDQICSMSMLYPNSKRFPMGLLASVSRNGLLLLWDIENEFYFADYQALVDPNRASSRINWFAVAFVSEPDVKRMFVAMSNSDSDISLLEIPENTRTKVRLKCVNERGKKYGSSNGTGGDEVIKHDKLIFNIKYNPSTKTIVTSSLDGNHIFWSVDKQQCETNTKQSAINIKPQFLYPGMLNNARTHMLRHSPIKEDLLGLALGKAGIRFFKITKSMSECRYDMSPSCSLISRKILKLDHSPTSLSWHPSHEYRLAIGTLEGKVFRADITPKKASLVEAEHKPIMVSNSGDNKFVGATTVADDLFGVDYQPIERAEMEEPEQAETQVNNGQPNSKTDGVYSLCWGPSPASPEDISKQAIYAIGSVSHRLFIYYSRKEGNDKMTNYLDEFRDQSLPEAQEEASEVSWKTSMDLMALGTTKGRIIIVSFLEDSHSGRSENRLFHRLAVIQGPLGGSFVQCLAWHLTSDKDDPRYYYLAASANESPAFVFNTRETILASGVKDRLKVEATGNSNLDRGTLILSAYMHKLEAHQKAISDIVWSPHEPNQLATCSFDRLAYVWSVGDSFMDGQIVSKFQSRDRLFTIEWSLVDEDLVFTSGNDSTVWAWRPSENAYKSKSGS